jgi:hypothetical protein
MSGTASELHAGRLAWRFGIGIGLIVCGYVALALIPVVAGTDMNLGVKTALSGLLATSPVLTKIAAIAVLGKEGFNALKVHIFKFLGRFRPSETVSRERYRIGLSLFVLSFVFDSLLPYLPGILVDWKSNETFWSLISDVVLIVSLFVLGGEFWNKLAALVRYDAKVSFPDDRSRDFT